MSRAIVAVVGNPNSGKTTLFNALTGARQRVGNWPGVTVEKKVGTYRDGGVDIDMVDLPGIYSIGPSDSSTDERIARTYVLSGEPRVIVNIVDASNLERNLYLTVQLLEMRVPMVVALNMMDVARQQGVQIDAARLEERLGVPVVPIVAARGEGVPELRATILAAIAAPRVPATEVRYAPAVEAALATLEPLLAGPAAALGRDPRWLAVQLLDSDEALARSLDAPARTALADAIAGIEDSVGDDSDILLADGRYGFIGGVAREAIHRPRQASRSASDRIDRVLLHRALGIPIFMALMYLMFMWTINIGGAFIDFFDILGGTLFVQATAMALDGIGSPQWLTVVLADGIGGGLQTVATFIPIIGFLFLFLSVLEDSGYMARAAFVMDRFMRSIGLPGKAFVPLIVGFGCTVPAVMATRTLESENDRKTTIAMSPFMSCGARLPVYALFAAAFFPASGQNLVFALYLIGILVAVLTGYLLKSTLLAGATAPLVLELPPYRMPRARNVVLRTWSRLQGFIVRAGRVIVPMVMVLSVLNSLGTDGSFGREDSDASVLAEIGRTVVPVFEPMGLQDDNWPAAVGIVTGLLAKEAVVGTLDALYGALGAEDGGAAAGEEEEVGLGQGVVAAFLSVPANLSDMAGMAADPLGLTVGDVSSADVAAIEQGVDAATFGAMADRFDGQVGAFAFLLFVLLYSPCLAAIAAIYRELNGRWALFVVAWTTGVAYGGAVLFYQAATFSRHPETATLWIGGLLAVVAVVTLALRYVGRSYRIVPQAAE